MGEKQDNDQMLAKLVELLTAKRDENSSTSLGKEIVSQADHIQKIELMPNDIKLEGIQNYLPWSRRAVRLLKARGLHGFIDKNSIEPRDKSSAEWKTWDATNSLVAAWLLNSMSPIIAESVDTITSAAEIWESLSKMYSGAGNVMLLAETEDKISELKQGDLPLMAYVAKLRKLWADVDHYDPIELPHADCVAWVKKWIEKRRVLQFLRGLNPEFEGRHAAMFHQTTLPSLEEAIAAMAQEEYRPKVVKDPALPPPQPTFVATGSNEARTCYNCGDKGHLIRDCPKPFKYNRGRGRGIGRGVPRGGASYGRGRGYRANLAMTEEGTSDLVTISAAGLEELRKLKKSSEVGDQGTTSSVDNVANLVYSNSGEEDWKKTWDWSQT